MPAGSDQAEMIDDNPAMPADDPGVEASEIDAGGPGLVRLGSNICDLRTSAGMTLESLARAASHPGRRLGSSWVSRWEAGGAQPGLLQALRLAGTLDCTLDRLVEGVFWNPGEIAARPRMRRPDSERMGGYLTVLPPGEPAFEEGTEVAVVADRVDVAAVIAGNVRDARARRHLRQRDLGLADSSGAGLIESGRRQPELQGLVTIARALEVPTEFLLRGMTWEPADQDHPASACRRGRRHEFHANDEAVTSLWRDDLTAAEIAAAVGITRASVEGIVRRLRARGVYLPSRTRGRRGAGAGVEAGSETEGRPAAAEDVGRLHDRLAANLRRLRLAAGLSLRQLAEAAEIGETSVWRAETHGHELSLITAVRLAGALRVPVVAICQGIAWEPQAGRLALEADGGTDPNLCFGQRLGASVRRHRRLLGLSQEEVAVRTGIYRRHFSAIESGRALPRPINLLILARGLETDLAGLLAGTCDWYVRPLPPSEYAEGEGPPSKGERQDLLRRMWREGASTRTIGDALDLTPSAVGGLINELRALGIEVPYRHPPTSAAQLSRRLRRRRRARQRAGTPPAPAAPARFTRSRPSERPAGVKRRRVRPSASLRGRPEG
ncbi:MAG: helix-turn-helix domain-containing protein [Solirubrobacterales bacterium]